MHARADFAGLEFDWYAVDTEGHIALFASAGYGLVPDAVFAHFDAQQAIGEQLLQFAGVSPRASLQQQSQAFAARGIYTYDWTATYGPYQRYAVPSEPTKLAEYELSAELQSAFILLPAVCFSAAAELRAADIPHFTAIDTRGA